MSIDSDTVRKTAALASIHITESEQQSLHQDLGKILDYVDQLSEVDTEGVEPLVSPFAEPVQWREDAVTDGDIQEQILRNAPEQKMGFFTVPKVVDN